MGKLNTYKLNDSENDWTTKNKGKNEQESTLKKIHSTAITITKYELRMCRTLGI